MPYSIKTEGDKFIVTNSDTDKPVPGGSHPTKKKAEKHMAALYAAVPDARKSMKSVFEEALKGGPGSGRHAEGGKDIPTGHRELSLGEKLKEGDLSKASNGKWLPISITPSTTDKDLTINKRDVGRYVRPIKSFRDSLKSNVTARVDELSLKGGPGSGRHAGSGSEKKDEPVYKPAHSMLKGEGYKHVGNNDAGHSIYLHPQSGNIVKIGPGGTRDSINAKDVFNKEQ